MDSSRYLHHFFLRPQLKILVRKEYEDAPNPVDGMLNINPHEFTTHVAETVPYAIPPSYATSTDTRSLAG